jgi:hypothetical protein
LLVSHLLRLTVLRALAILGSADRCNRSPLRFGASTFIDQRVPRSTNPQIGFFAVTHGWAKAMNRSAVKFFLSTSMAS